MLFRTKVFVVCALQDSRFKDMPGYDSAAYTFGINAGDAADAAAIAVRAAENAIGRNGDFIGGVVLEVHSKCVGPEEFTTYQKYLLQPLDERGVFYVSGVIHSSVAPHEANGAAKALQHVRDWIEENGLPTPSFVHPPLKDDDGPKNLRIVCPVCERWVEVGHGGVIYSFFDGLDRLSEEYQEGQLAVQIAGPFVKSHFACLAQSADAKALVFLYEDDERYELLDESKRDGPYE